MREVYQSQATSVNVVLVDATSGDTLTEVVWGEITLNYLKSNTVFPTTKTIDFTNFTEIDPINMPGVYRIDFTASELDTLGEFTFTIQEASSTNGTIAQTNVMLIVREEPANSTDVTTLTSAQTSILEGLNQIKGANFVESIHSLSADYMETPFVGDIEQNTSATVTVKVGERTGIESGDLEADLVKAGTADTTTLLSSWQEIDSTNLPGVYRFTLSNTDTDTLGDLLVRIEQVTGTSSEFLGVQFLQPSLGDISFSGSPVDVAALANEDGVAVITDGVPPLPGEGGGEGGGVVLPGEGGGEAIPGVAYTTDGGSNWNNITIPVSFNPGRRLAYNANTNRLALLMGNSPSLTLSLSSVPSDFSNVSLTSTIDVHPFSPDTSGGLVGSGLSIVDDGASNDFIWIAAGDGEENSPPTGDIVRVDDTGGTDAVVRDGSTASANGEVYFDVFAFDDQTAVAVAAQWQTADISTPNTYVYKTTDGGSSWTTAYSDTDTALPIQASFDSTGQYGFVTVYNDFDGSAELAMLQTTDGGDSWTKIISNLGGSLIEGLSAHRGLHVIDQDNVIVGLSVGSDVADLDNEFYLLQSKDGAQTFNKVDVSGTITSGVLWGIDGVSNQTFGAVQSPSPTNNDVVQYGHNPFPDALKDLSYKFNVVGETSVDLTPVIDALDEIKGSGFMESTDSLEALSNSSSTVESIVERILGLSQENYRISNQSYNGDNQLTGATVRIYENASDASNDVNPIAEYSLSADYDSQGQMIDYLVVEV